MLDREKAILARRILRRKRNHRLNSIFLRAGETKQPITDDVRSFCPQTPGVAIFGRENLQDLRDCRPVNVEGLTGKWVKTLTRTEVALDRGLV